MSRTIRKQPKRDRPRLLRPESNKKTSFKKQAYGSNSVDFDEEFKD